jgi:uncharacterized membrane protein YgaE (UPF0421/DUF939 family)
MPGLDRLRRLVGSYRAEIAVKASIAAAMSSVLAEGVVSVFGALEDYRYYAPLGAVTVTYPSVAAAARTAKDTVWALLLGAGLGLLVHEALEPGLLSLTLVVGVGIALGSLPGLGEQRSWVPVVALFVLVIGGSHPVTYAAAYVGLAALGALCGVAVNVLLPTLPLRTGQESVEQLRTALAGHLNDVADGLRDRTPPAEEAWRRQRADLGVAVDSTRRAVQDLLRAQRGNVRARFHRRDVRQQDEVAGTLDRVAVLAHDLMAVLDETHREGREPSPLDADLAATVADAVDRLADLVLVYSADLTPDDPRVRRVDEAIGRLTAEFGRRGHLEPDDLALLGAVVANLRWSASAIRPPAA